MEPQTPQDTPADADRHNPGMNNAWMALGTLYRWRFFIGGVTFTMAILSVAISLILPNWYKAQTRLLLPESTSGGLSTALLGDLGSAARSLLGGGGGDYVRYISILSSRTMLDQVVDTFNLVRVYEVADSETPQLDARKSLSDNVEFLVDSELEFLSVEVLDQDPQRAADIANYFVKELNRINRHFSALTAGHLRTYVEQRYASAQKSRATLLDSLQSFQQRYGVFDLTAQTTAYFEQLSDLRIQAIQAEIQLDALRDQFGQDNPQVQSFASVVRAAEQKYQQALAGREQILPIPKNQVPQVVRQYFDLEMERVIQERILELVAPMLEQARFEEQRMTEAVQVLDRAIPPERKAKPKRSIICITATLSAFLLAIIFVLLMEWWKRNHVSIAHRLSDAVAPPPAGRPR